MRYTVTAAVSGSGDKLPISCIFRWTKKLQKDPKWFKDMVNPPCKCFFTKGSSQSSKSMLDWLKEILVPYLDAILLQARSRG